MESRVWARHLSACGRGSDRLAEASAARSARKPRTGQSITGCATKGWGWDATWCTGTDGTGAAFGLTGVVVEGMRNMAVGVTVGVEVGEGDAVGVLVGKGREKDAGGRVCRTGFAGRGAAGGTVGVRVAAGVEVGVGVGLGGGTWTVPTAWALFPIKSHAEACTG